ncbi:hypothetical protein GCM10022223_11390 [Kineosporia mesophila]|uniref:HTH araC/xylS-type domain-containing protein n=1 Tax=Kineosporia mesophila TaxID=566012 RepID=A0ABP6Z9G0_9ACTN|nr:AraC family transcriptional regulator [Kineosporia mesophila]
MNALDSVLSAARTHDARHERLVGRRTFPGDRPGNQALVVWVAAGPVTVAGSALAAPAPSDGKLVTGDVLFAGPDASFVLEAAPDAEVHVLSLDIEPLSADALGRALPPLIALESGGEAARSAAAAMLLISQEHAGARPGASVITSRLADVVYVTVVRAAALCLAQGTWLALLNDPRLARAVSAAHDDLSRGWTVAHLAAVAGMSRSAFAAAFRATSGQGPMEHLTWWRLYRAKCLLRSTDLDITQIAAQLGFSSGTALSRVFRQHTGVSPTPWRRARASDPSWT